MCGCCLASAAFLLLQLQNPFEAAASSRAGCPSVPGWVPLGARLGAG